jgi:hypothetical protein
MALHPITQIVGLFLKVSLCCALAHIHVYGLGYAMRMPVGSTKQNF